MNAWLPSHMGAHDWVYPTAVTALTFVVLIPALTALALLALRLHRAKSQRWGQLGGNFPLMCIAAPSAVPLLALFTSSVQSLFVGEAAAAGEGSSVVCVLDHVQMNACLDNLVLVAGLSLLLSVVALWHALPMLRASSGRRLPRQSAAQRRVRALLASSTTLRKLRCTVHADASAPAATLGLLRPRVVLDACFVDSADDEALTAALLHEAEHARQFDPLRLLFTRICLSLNPAARPLYQALSDWRHARESDCDDHAVRTGGAPLALASALVQAARFRCVGSRCGTHLTGPAAAGLQLRLTHLMVGHDGATDATSMRAARARPWLLATCVAASASPIIVDTGLIATIHRLSEFAWLGLL